MTEPTPDYPPQKDPDGKTFMDEAPMFLPVQEEPAGYSVEDAYRILTNQPLSPVETTPVE